MPGALPHLPFTYADRLDEGWHLAALAELVRVAAWQVRVFPLVSHVDGSRCPYLDRLRDDLAERGIDSEVRRVGYEVQRGGDEMLVLDGCRGSTGVSDRRRLVPSAPPWEGPVGCSRAVRVGDHVRVAGTTAAQPDGGAVGGEDACEQAREALRWIAGAHGEVFAAIRPASTMIGVSALIDPTLLVEIEADAVVLRPSAPPP